MISIKKIIKCKGQATIELALILPLLFALTFFGIYKIFIPIYKTKTREIDMRNKALRDSQNAKLGALSNGKFVIPDMTKFNIPGGKSFKPPWEILIPIVLDPLSDQLMDKLGLGSTDSWWKSGARGGVDAYIKSGFNPSEIKWGAAYGVVGSGDVTHLLTSELGSVGGAGLQGALAGAITTKFTDWDSALTSGLDAVWKTDTIKKEMNKIFGKKDLVLASVSGAIGGAITGGAEGALKGAAQGALASSTVQKVVGNTLGNKDVLVNATNMAAYTAISGNTHAILTNAAQAAFLSGSVQKAILGENPKSLIKNTLNSTFAGGMRAIETKDVKQLYYGVAGGVVNEVVSKGVKMMYPEPNNPVKLQSYMENQQFITGLTTQGILMLSSKDFVKNYSELLSAQLITKVALDKLMKSKAAKNTPTIPVPVFPRATDTDKENAKKLLEEKEKTQSSINIYPQKQNKFADFKMPNLNLKMAADLNASLPGKSTDSLKAELLKTSQTPKVMLASADNFSRKFAKADYTSSEGPIKVETDKTRQTGSQENTSTTLHINERYANILDAIESVTPEEVAYGDSYKEIAKNKPFIKATLKNELKRNLISLNAVILSTFGYIDSDIDTMLSGKEFSKSLEKAVSDPLIEREINKIVERTFNPENIMNTIKNIQEKIIEERAFYAEMQLRQLLWRYTKKSTIYSKKKEQNIILEIYGKIKDGIAG